MMAVQMDNMSAPSSRERVQRLYQKNIELESKRRKAGQGRVLSDPNAWQQMRENYETIILEDHAFSEQHNIEYALWQLHYRRIEEHRALFNAALASTGSNSTTQGGANVTAQREKITRIRLQFKTFLSEATGFYHDLISKIRAKYGLPLGYFSEDSDNRAVMESEGKKSADVKKGLMSCHRCLIYLGDLARYKGVYGEGDSKTREYNAASSYYLQAASLNPSSGNPHHQLAILASYSGEELAAVYHYFRSLAVENPFATARDNLIVAFEKNRQSYSQLVGDASASATRELPGRLTGRARGNKETKPSSNSTSSSEANAANPETFKSLCTRFVRLNGIMFTRTSMETFPEVLELVNRGFSYLLSSGPKEELSFGADAADNGLFIVRLIAILIFTVHNVKKEVDGQTYAEIVQRDVRLQNALTAVFEIVGIIFERGAQLQDPSSSYLLPGILVFVEWLACCPDVASGSDDANEKQGSVRLKFWNHCISFLNNILSNCSMSLDDNEDDTCFVNMSRYDEGETQNRLALSEDFELRGYLPLLPAHTILDFSRKHSFGNDGSKGKVARIKRILAAGKVLTNMVRVDQKTIHFDAKAKKFVLGAEPRVSEAFMVNVNGDLPKPNGVVQEIPTDKTQDLGILCSNPQFYVEEEEENEEIVFKPAVTEKQNGVSSQNWPLYDGLKSSQNVSTGDLQCYGAPISAPLDNLQHLSARDLVPAIPTSASNQHLQPMQLSTSKWLDDESSSLANSLKAVRFMENGNGHPVARPVLVQPSVNVHGGGMFYGQTHLPAAVVSSRVDVMPSGGITQTLAARTSVPTQVALGKSPVNRPVRQLGPPPGFRPVPPRQVSEPLSGSEFTTENPLGDNYGWLDGYQLPSSAIGSTVNGSTNFPSHASPQFVGNSAGMPGFPFPGRQLPPVQFQAEKQSGWQNFQALEQLRIHQEQQMQLQLQQQLINGNQQLTPTPEQYHGQSIWGGRYIV